MASEATIDLEPMIRRAIKQMHVQVDAWLADQVAEHLRAMGWTCVPPEGWQPIVVSEEAST